MAKKPKKTYTLAQKLRDPAKRSKLPMSALSPTQQAQRRARLRKTAVNANPLYDPTAPLSGTGLKSAVDEIVAGQIAPQTSALDRQARDTTVQGTALADRTAGYYSQIAQREADALARQQAISQRLNIGLADVASQTDQRFTDLAAQTAGQGMDVTGEAAAQRARLAESAQAFRSAGQLQGANYEGLQKTSGSAQELAAIEAQRELATRLANKQTDIAGQRADVEAQAGALRTKTLTDLRQTGFENLATMQGLGIKQTDLSLQAKKDAADLSLKTRQQTAKERKDAADINLKQTDPKRVKTQLEIDYFEKHHRWPSTGTPKKGATPKPRNGLGSLTQTQENAIAQQISQAVALINDPASKGHADTQLRGWLMTGQNPKKTVFSKNVVNAAFDLARLQGLSAANIKALHDMGVHVVGRFPVLTKKKPSPGARP